MIEFETVVEREFVALLDLSKRNDPDLIVDDLGFAVRITAVVDELCRIVRDIAIDVVVVIEDEHVDGGVTSTLALIG